MGLVLTMLSVLAQSPTTSGVMDRAAMQERLDLIDTELRVFKPLRDPVGGLLMGLGFGTAYVSGSIALGTGLALLLVGSTVAGATAVLVPILLVALSITVVAAVVGFVGYRLESTLEAEAKTRREVLMHERDSLKQALDEASPSVVRPAPVPLFTLARF